MASAAFIKFFIVVVASRASISIATPCSEDNDCYLSGGRKCCFDKCSPRKYCGNNCFKNDDCDISKQENCFSNKCTTDTLPPKQCHHSYECDPVTEICVDGKCKEMRKENDDTDVPKSGNTRTLAVSLLPFIIPAVVVILLVIGVCFANHKIRLIRTRMNEGAQDHHEQSTEMPSVIHSLQPHYPLPRAPPLPPYDMSSDGKLPSQAPPSYEDAMKNHYSYATAT